MDKIENLSHVFLSGYLACETAERLVITYVMLWEMDRERAADYTSDALSLLSRVRAVIDNAVDRENDKAKNLLLTFQGHQKLREDLMSVITDGSVSEFDRNEKLKEIKEVLKKSCKKRH